MTDEKQFETVSTDIEHHEAPDVEPEPKRAQPAFGLGKVGAAVIAVLVVGLIALHMGYTPDSSLFGRDAGGFAGNSDYGGYDWGGSSYDWGGSSSYDYDYDWDWDDDDWDWVGPIPTTPMSAIMRKSA